MTTATAEQIDRHLDDVAIAQLTWKPGAITDISLKIVHSALANGTVWPDEINLSAIPDSDRNCVGSAFRILSGTRAEILQKTGSHRRSQRKESAGRIIWEYRLASRARALTFIQRNDRTQPELF